MAITPEEKEYIVEEAVRILRSGNAEGLIETLKEQLEAPGFEDDLSPEDRRRSEVVLAIVEAVQQIGAKKRGSKPGGGKDE